MCGFVSFCCCRNNNVLTLLVWSSSLLQIEHWNLFHALTILLLIVLIYDVLLLLRYSVSYVWFCFILLLSQQQCTHVTRMIFLAIADRALEPFSCAYYIVTDCFDVWCVAIASIFGKLCVVLFHFAVVATTMYSRYSYDLPRYCR